MIGRPGGRSLPHSRRRARGFTLLELLLAVAIMSAMALVTLDLLETDTDQLHFDVTRGKLSVLRQAVVGNTDPNRALHIAAYVTDNGDLPFSIFALINKTIGLDDFAEMSPVFDPVPDGNGFNNGPGTQEITLNGATEKLYKGFRSSYVDAEPASGEFRDGWGNTSAIETEDTANFGWQVTVDSATDVAAAFTVVSLGKDGSSGGTEYAQDMTLEVHASDWKNNSAFAVTVVNYTGTDINLTAPRVSRLALLVYVNGSGWKRIDSSDSFSCLDGDGDGLVAAVPCANSVALNFAVGTDIPVGRHLLLLVDDPDGTVQTADDTAFLNGGNRVTDILTFNTRSVPQSVVLAIR